mmetsp:Transcript_3610/g.9035  ORF Transcript_3610/g.9035 Transcript_3610/m.9035 type:complete len:243 (-) Transcript_3610:305-1033(-)
MHRSGISFLYSGPVASSQNLFVQVFACCVTIVALDYLHDTWFYFTHLWMHKWRWLYSHVHYLHHQSKVPTAFSGYSLHVAEAALVFFDEIIVCFLFPIHVNVHRLYHLYTTLIHIGGHAGYELHPLVPSLEQVLWLLVGGNKVSMHLNTVLYHCIHHQFPNKHLSLYFTHWDKWLGTQKTDYHAQIGAIKKEQAEKLANSPRASPGIHYAILLMCMLWTLVGSVLAYVSIYHIIHQFVSKKT